MTKVAEIESVSATGDYWQEWEEKLTAAGFNPDYIRKELARYRKTAVGWTWGEEDFKTTLAGIFADVIASGQRDPHPPRT